MKKNRAKLLKLLVCLCAVLIAATTTGCFNKSFVSWGPLADDSMAVSEGQQITLTAPASTSSNGSPIVAYQWQATGGTLSNINGNTATWTAPNTAGNYSVNVRAIAKDGKASPELTWTLVVVDKPLIDYFFFNSSDELSKLGAYQNDNSLRITQDKKLEISVADGTDFHGFVTSGYDWPENGLRLVMDFYFESNNAPGWTDLSFFITQEVAGGYFSSNWSWFNYMHSSGTVCGPTWGPMVSPYGVMQLKKNYTYIFTITPEDAETMSEATQVRVNEAIVDKSTNTEIANTATIPTGDATPTQDFIVNKTAKFYYGVYIKDKDRAVIDNLIITEL